MKIESIIRRHSIRCLGLAVLTLCIYLPAARAQKTEQTRQITVIQDMVVIGLVPGQSLRLNVLNFADDQNGGSMMGHVKVMDGTRVPLFETSEVEIEPDQFHSFEIKRSDISAPGDSRTGRVEVRIQLVLTGNASDMNVRARIDKLPSQIELVDDDTGKTVVMGMLLPAIQKVREAPNR